MTKLRRQRGGHRPPLHHRPRRGERLLRGNDFRATRAREEQGAHDDLYSGHDLDVGGEGEGKGGREGGGIFDHSSRVFDPSLIPISQVRKPCCSSSAEKSTCNSSKNELGTLWLRVGTAGQNDVDEVSRMGSKRKTFPCATGNRDRALLRACGPY